MEFQCAAIRSAVKRAKNDRFLAPDAPPADRMGADVAAFLTARDGVCQAGASISDWPYVQFGGGPPGFLKVLDDRTLGHAELRGTRRHVGAGTLSGNGRASLIAVDCPARRRLKIRAEAELIDAADAPDFPGFGASAMPRCS